MAAAPVTPSMMPADPTGSAPRPSSAVTSAIALNSRDAAPCGPALQPPVSPPPAALNPPPPGERMADLLSGRAPPTHEPAAPAPAWDPHSKPPKRQKAAKPFLIPSSGGRGEGGTSDPLVAGERTPPGVDRRTADRLRRGKLPIDATLDLHGYRQIDAMMALFSAIEGASARAQRKLLVITGKGTFDRPGADRGVLKRQLPHWLNDPRIRDRVLAFSPARPEHGGGGAFYVLLRRPRG